MSVDVGGLIEVRAFETSEWKGIESIKSYIDRRSEMLNCLFGSGYGSRFPPVAPGRGVPADVSPEVRRAEDAWGPPPDREDQALEWITWAEIAAIDWDEPILTGYERFIHTKHRGLIPDRPRDRRHGEHLRERLQQEIDRLGGWPEGAEDLEVDGAIYLRAFESRRVVLSEDWRLLFRKMEQLAATYGPDGVRLIVWLIA